MNKTPAMYAAYALQTMILIYTICSAAIGYMVFAISGSIVFVLTLVPYIVERRANVIFPWGVHILILSCIYLHGLGAIFGFYDTLYPVFDKITHLTSSVITTLMVFLVILLLDRARALRLDSRLMLVLLISTTLALGAVWEILEFLIDQSFSLQLQHGLEDTMYDLLCDLMGATLVGVGCYLYLGRLSREEVEEYLLSRTDGDATSLPD